MDVDDRKLEWARGFGATDVLNSRTTDPVTGIRELTGGFGADVVIEAIGRPETYEQAFYARDLAGRAGAGRRADAGDAAGIAAARRVRPRRGAQFFWYGRSARPARDFPMLVDLHLAGRLPLDKFVSETIALGDVEEAFAKMGRGEVLRSVVTL